jgi:hypothetical protein
MNKKELMLVAIAGVASYFIFKYLLAKNNSEQSFVTSDVSSRYIPTTDAPAQRVNSLVQDYMVA